MSDRSKADWDAYIWKNEILPRLENCDVPERCRINVPKWTVRKQGEVYRECVELFTGKGAIVALVGPRGTGKTTLATQLIVRLSKQEGLNLWEYWFPYRKMVDLVSKYKSLYGDFGSIHSESLISSRNALCRAPGLIIDEIHECDDMKLKGIILTDIADRRYSNLKDTLLIANQTPEEFRATTSDSVLSRLAEHGKIIPCNWQSWRDKQAT